MTDTLYFVDERLNAGLVRITHPRYGRQLWAKRKIRGAKACEACRVEKPSGEEMFGPITNGYNRMHRLCAGCVEKL